jgi:hypothetical protein
MRIAVIIGKRGVTINAIQFVSGAKVQVAQQQPGSAFTDVNITGATPALKKRERERGSHGRWKRPCLQTAHMAI